MCFLFLSSCFACNSAASLAIYILLLAVVGLFFSQIRQVVGSKKKIEKLPHYFFRLRLDALTESNQMYVCVCVCLVAQPKNNYRAQITATKRQNDQQIVLLFMLQSVQMHSMQIK